MFGYIKPNIPNLRVKEHELYKATYCGLCKTMGKCTGCMSNFTLSYDFVFLSLVHMVTKKVEGVVKKGRCIAHPFKSRPMLKQNEALEFSAKASVILTRMKLKDNINDSHGISKLKAKLVGLVSVFLKKTDKDLKPLEEKVKECIDNLSKLENEGCDSIDKTANTFGDLLGSVASYEYEGALARILYDIGYHLGKWIYVIDAVDDIKDDIKKKSFNVFVNSYGVELTKENKDAIYCAMMLELDSMSKSVELLDFSAYPDIEGIIKNIIYDGMVMETNKVLGLDGCECVKN